MPHVRAMSSASTQSTTLHTPCCTLPQQPYHELALISETSGQRPVMLVCFSVAAKRENRQSLLESELLKM